LTLLVITVSLTLSVSFLCSLLEAALLSVPIASLAERRQESRGIRWLHQLKGEHFEDAISTILTLNTISNTLGATIAGVQVNKILGDIWIGVFSGCLTLAILTCSEIIPKTLGAMHCKALAEFVGWSLKILTISMAPFLILTRTLTRLVGRGSSDRISRGEVEAVIEMAGTQGTLASHESALYGNIMRFDKILVGDVMTPRTVTYSLPADSPYSRLLREERSGGVPSRIPIYRGSRDDVVGYVLLREVQRAAIEGEDLDTPLETLSRDVRFIPEVATLRQALGDLITGKDPIAIVADEHGGVCGLVTMEDLIETILGVEIVDEHDEVADLRDLAKDIRNRRLQRLRDKRQLHPEWGEGDDTSSKR